MPLPMTIGEALILMTRVAAAAFALGRLTR